jgi:hypothetical protein
MAKKLVVGAEAPLEIITVTVSKASYDRAAKALRSNSYYVLTQCLVAQAVKPLFKGKLISVGSEDVEIHHRSSELKSTCERKFTIDKKGQRLIENFDNDKVDRKKLPVTIKLTEIPDSGWF